MFLQLPTLNQILLYGPIFFFIIFLIGFIAGIVKRYAKIRTNYTRKIFHVGIFTVAAVISLLSGFELVILFGVIAGIYTLLIIFLGEGNLLYEGIAREQDAPHRSLHIILPFFATALGGLLSNYLFSSLAVTGYLVAGWGDAAGEIIGPKFGKHKYHVPTIGGIRCSRSLEGSIAVFVTTFFLISIYLYKIISMDNYYLILIALAAAFATTIIEAISPHGTDNFTTQLAATAICFFMI